MLGRFGLFRARGMLVIVVVVEAVLVVEGGGVGRECVLCRSATGVRLTNVLAGW